MPIISAPIPPPHPSTFPLCPHRHEALQTPATAAAPLLCQGPDPPGLKGTGREKGPQDPMAGPRLPRSAPWLRSCSTSRRRATCKSSTGTHRHGPNGLGRRKGEGERTRNCTEDTKIVLRRREGSGFPSRAPLRSLLPSPLRGEGGATSG